ncbi:hypothetical protein AAFF_G00367660 [Aldrovandia affinis]|uniref:Reverse transcriptase zinc-binding domain-containing protein n=1 Tax=Aldrovandia affinis TaxID=143900 RepID=A0AAD7R741_9TELE|nr:hypothetical protein AAFF_G00367660 [Aldrovandia affinis]
MVPGYLVEVPRFVQQHSLAAWPAMEWRPRAVVAHVAGFGKPVVIGQFRTTELATIWKRVAERSPRNEHRVVAWQAVHGCLPVRDLFYRRRLAQVRTCPREGCGAEETVSHVLWDCGYARRVRTLVMGVFGKFVSVGDVTKDFVVYGLLARNYGVVDGACGWVLACCLKVALWRARNLWVAKRVALSDQEGRALMMGLVREYVGSDRRRWGEPYVQRTWKGLG